METLAQDVRYAVRMMLKSPVLSGLAILSSVAASRTSAIRGVTHATALVDGFQLAFLVGAGLMLSAIAVIVVLIRRRHVASIGTEDALAVPA